MLIRISLIIAIIAGLAVGGLNFVKVKEKITTLQENLKTQTARADKAEKDLADTRKELDKTVAELKQTKATLEATTAERDKAVADVASLTKKSDQLTEDLGKAKQERNEAQQELAAYKGTGLSPEQIITINKQYKNLEATLATSETENKILAKTIKKLETELALFRDQEFFVSLPAGLTGKVLIADPKWHFVVINVGEDQGMLKDGELLVNRNGRLVAKVRVSSVQKDRSVANVMPGWQLSEVMEGDQVIPAHPAS